MSSVKNTDVILCFCDSEYHFSRILHCEGRKKTGTGQQYSNSFLFMSDAFSMNHRHEQEFKNKAVGWRLTGIRL